MLYYCSVLPERNNAACRRRYQECPIRVGLTHSRVNTYWTVDNTEKYLAYIDIQTKPFLAQQQFDSSSVRKSYRDRSYSTFPRNIGIARRLRFVFPLLTPSLNALLWSSNF